jgi:glycine/D-amino acid oxidase-like deaminating enzyme
MPAIPAPPPDTADVIVAGAGLAGASVALALSETRRVVLLDAAAPGAGASGAAAGLANPFTGRKARAGWRWAEAIDALDRLLDAADASPLLHRAGIVRPAHSERQAEAFAQRAAEHPGDLEWWTGAATRERWPHVAAPHGALFVRRGGHLDVGRLVEAAVDTAQARGVSVQTRCALTGWRCARGGVVAETERGEVRARHLVLALGDGARQLTALAALPLVRVKGQTVTVARPNALPAGHPAVAGRGYVVPGPASVVVGATFEHDFASAAPDPALDAGLVEAAARLVPALEGARVLDRRAGVRLGVPASVSPRRLPYAGPLPGHPGVWVLTGLGSKGLLAAPLLASLLPAALDGRAPMPPETRPPG